MVVCCGECVVTIGAVTLLCSDGVTLGTHGVDEQRWHVGQRVSMRCEMRPAQRVLECRVTRRGAFGTKLKTKNRFR